MLGQTNEALAGLEARLGRELSGDWPAAVEVLRKAQLEVSRIERGEGRDGIAPWLLYARPAKHLAQAFELAPEVLVLLAPGHEAQARDIEQAQTALAKGLRLDRSMVLVLTVDAGARRRLEHVVRATHRQYLFVTIKEVLAVVDPHRWLRQFLRQQLGAADLFASGRPVVGWDFFGRTVELERMRQHLVAGRPVGLYGLRKIGKTSLVLQELARLAEETRRSIEVGGMGEQTLPFHIDMQALAMESNLAGFMRQLVKSLFEGMKTAGLSPQSLGLDPAWEDAKTLRRYPDARIKKLGAEALESAIEWARGGSGRRVVAFIDEYERLFESEVFPISDALTILDYLRGLVQGNTGKFNFIIAGLTRHYASRSMVGRRQNPLFNFVVDFPLAGLAREELKSLLRKIGGRLGLDFDAGAVEEIWEQTGGHPALARDYGRVIDQFVERSARVEGARVDRALVRERYSTFARQVEMTMEDIARAVAELDEQGPYVLSELAAGGSTPLESSVLSADAVEQLRRLGILIHADREPHWTIAIASFARWLIGNYPGRQVAGLVG